ncbi:uncharacterized [Tachysurus ichikawai]
MITKDVFSWLALIGWMQAVSPVSALDGMDADCSIHLAAPSGLMAMRLKSASLIHTWGSTPPVRLGKPPLSPKTGPGDWPKALKCRDMLERSLNPIFLAESTHICLLVHVNAPPLGMVLIARH